MYTPEQIQVLLKLGLDPSKQYSYELKKKKVSCWDNPVWLEIQKTRNCVANAYKKPYKKTSKVFKYLGCSHEELRLHLERQFLKGMTWENKGLWHIDHIIPISSAKTIEGVHVLAKYTNLRPLWQKDNREKHAKKLFLI